MEPLPLIYGNVHREKMNELDDLRPGNARREPAGAGGMVKDPEDLWLSMRKISTMMVIWKTTLDIQKKT